MSLTSRQFRALADEVDDLHRAGMATFAEETADLHVDAARSGRRGRRDRYKAYTDRAKSDFTAWLAPSPVPA